MSPIIIVGLVVLSFMSVKSFTGNPIEKETKADVRAMERRLDPSHDAQATETGNEPAVPQEQAQTTDTTSPVSIIQVPGANPPVAEVLDPQGDFPSDVDTSGDLGDSEIPLEDDTDAVNNPEDPVIDFPEGDETPAPVGDIFPDNNDSGLGSDPQSDSGLGDGEPVLGAPEETAPAPEQGG